MPIPVPTLPQLMALLLESQASSPGLVTQSYLASALSSGVPSDHLAACLNAVLRLALRLQDGLPITEDLDLHPTLLLAYLHETTHFIFGPATRAIQQFTSAMPLPQAQAYRFFLLDSAREMQAQAAPAMQNLRLFLPA